MSTLAKKPPWILWWPFELLFKEEEMTNRYLDNSLKNLTDGLDPLKVLNIFKQILAIDC